MIRMVYLKVAEKLFVGVTVNGLYLVLGILKPRCTLPVGSAARCCARMSAWALVKGSPMYR